VLDALPWPPTDPEIVLACTIWMEARGDGLEGMHAVASVVLNRARNPRWWGKDIVSVCLMHDQFSSWNAGSTQTPLVCKAMGDGDAAYTDAVNIARLAMSGALEDITENSDSYYSVKSDRPDWALPEYFTKQIGSQKFYRTELPFA
jgi:N-acetylmuramoyl-L-alanine amidase